MCAGDTWREVILPEATIQRTPSPLFTNQFIVLGTAEGNVYVRPYTEPSLQDVGAKDGGGWRLAGSLPGNAMITSLAVIGRQPSGVMH